MLALNLLLAVVWAVATGTFDALTLAVGFVLGYVALALTSTGRRTGYARWLPRAVVFVGRYGVELTRSGLQVAYDVVTPKSKATPRLVRVPLDARTDAEIAVVANLISLTPGTLTIDVAPDRRSLLVHVMFAEGGDDEAVAGALKAKVERPLLDLFR